MEDYQKYLDPKILSRVTKLDVIARLIVEGFISGLHKSPYHGFSVEFAEHREYVPGDDIKHVDWKVFGRSDRYYIKQYEEETNLKAHIMLDVSESMKYSSNSVSKLEYGRYIAAAMAYLMVQQQDAVGMVLFDDSVRKFIRASSQPSHLKLILKELGDCEPTGKTDVSEVFHDIAERVKRRGLIIVISDLFSDPEKVLFGLRHFRHKRHEVIVFHVLDPFEVKFPFDDLTLFEGLEAYPELLSDPRALRKSYVAAMDSFLTKVKEGCRNSNIDYVRLTTDQTLDVALSAYLASRLKK